MSVPSRLDKYQREHPSVGFPIAVLYKYLDDDAGSLAALITFYGFLAVFPMLLLASNVLGIVLAGNPGAQKAVLHSALSQFPVIGSQLQDLRRDSGTAGLLVGGLVGLFGGLGVTVAAQNAMNTAWTVPKNERPNPIKVRLRGLLLLLTTGSALLGTGVLSALGGGVGPLGTWSRVLAVVASTVVAAGAFVVIFRLATARDLSVRDVAPGAAGAAVVWQLLQFFGAGYVNHIVRHSSNTNGVFALVLGLIAFIYVAAVAVMVCVEVNVVRVDRLHPRAMLAPLTSDVELTEGDERAFADQARAHRYTDSQRIDVSFEEQRQ